MKDGLKLRDKKLESSKRKTTKIEGLRGVVTVKSSSELKREKTHIRNIQANTVSPHSTKVERKDDI